MAFLSTKVVSPISIHALREEGDHWSNYNCPRISRFLSTPSARRATPDDGNGTGKRNISIHALREEGDLVRLACISGI